MNSHLDYIDEQTFASVRPSVMGQVPLLKVSAEYPIYNVNFPLLSPRFEELPPFPPRSNPFHHDSYNMGQEISFGETGRKYTLMYSGSSGINWFIICDYESGRRFKVTFVDVLDVKDHMHYEIEFNSRYGMYPQSYKQRLEAHSKEPEIIGWIAVAGDGSRHYFDGPTDPRTGYDVEEYFPVTRAG